MSLPINALATVLSGSGSVTGSFAGFTAIQNTTFTGLKGYNGGDLVVTSSAPLIVAAGTTLSLLITSASISVGGVFFYY